MATLVGSVFQTWLASRESQMNTTATFVGLLFFGWIWGFWGLLIGIPLLAIVKTVCEYNEDWKPVAELLSRQVRQQHVDPVGDREPLGWVACHDEERAREATLGEHGQDVPVMVVLAVVERQQHRVRRERLSAVHRRRVRSRT